VWGGKAGGIWRNAWIGQGVGALIRNLDMLGWELGCGWVPDCEGVKQGGGEITEGVGKMICVKI
jgi:hypothetical protein